MKIRYSLIAAGVVALGVAGSAMAQEKTLRLLTWADYAPADVVAQFEKESGYKVELTLSNNEEMISKLRATGGAGFDLAQPSQDRITGPQSRVRHLQADGPEQAQEPSCSSRPCWKPPRKTPRWPARSTACRTSGAPTAWWSTPSLTKMADYPDLCRADVKGKIAMRLKRPTLLAFAFASGKDPFALYSDPKAYGALMDDVGKTLIDCKKNLKFFWDNKDQLLNGMRTGEIVGAMMWDTGGWKLNGEKAEIQFIAPKSGALGWIDTFALPAKGKNDAAAYAWINFNMRPEIAAKVAGSAGNFTASKGADQLMDAKLKAQFADSFPEAALKNVKWYPAVPAGIEDIEGRVLDRVKAAN